MNYESGTIKNVHYGDVLINYGEYIDVSSANLPYISDDSKADKYSKSFLNDGDIVIADTAEDETVGKCTEIRNTDGIDVLAGLHTIPCRPIEKYGTKYLGYYMNSPAYHNQLKPLMQGIKVTSVSKTALQDTVISCPKSIDEQTQIGALLSNVDTIITLHQRKCDELKIYKKGLLQQMFPQPGETFPRIRFPGFTDPWEQRKFGDIGSVSMCKRIFKEETSVEGDIPFYKIGTFGSEADAFISRELFEDYKSRFSYPEDGAILLSASGTIGRIVEYKGEEAYFQDSNIVWLSHDKTVCNKFLKVLYPTIKWDGIEGSTIQRLYNDNFLKTRFMMPKLPEQEKLGAFFEGVDNLITLHQRKCDELKIYKKGLLQKMFV